MAAAGLLLPTLAVSANGMGRGSRIRNSVNIDVHRRDRDQSSEIPSSPLIGASSNHTNRECRKGILRQVIVFIRMRGK